MKKEWENYLEVKESYIDVTPSGAPTFGRRWGVFVKATNSNASKGNRFYSREIDAKRGAAQIYRQIEKNLLKKS